MYRLSGSRPAGPTTVEGAEAWAPSHSSASGVADGGRPSRPAIAVRLPHA